MGDNAVAESGVHTLNPALLSLEDLHTREPAQTAVVADSAVFETRPRCHSAHGYLAPLADEPALNPRGIWCPEKC